MPLTENACLCIDRVGFLIGLEEEVSTYYNQESDQKRKAGPDNTVVKSPAIQVGLLICFFIIAGRQSLRTIFGGRGDPAPQRCRMIQVQDEPSNRSRQGDHPGNCMRPELVPLSDDFSFVGLPHNDREEVEGKYKIVERKSNSELIQESKRSTALLIPCCKSDT